jgi:hypothetical protein
MRVKDPDQSFARAQPLQGTNGTASLATDLAKISRKHSELVSGPCNRQMHLSRRDMSVRLPAWCDCFVQVVTCDTRPGSASSTVSRLLKLPTHCQCSEGLPLWRWWSPCACSTCKQQHNSRGSGFVGTCICATDHTTMHCAPLWAQATTCGKQPSCGCTL